MAAAARLMPAVRRWLVPLALIGLPLLFFHRLAFSDWILARGDTFAYFYPYWQARSAALLAGQLPLWSPDLFMGVPLLANSQLGVFYPPNWLLAPLSPPDAIRISLLIHAAWMLAGAYLLARAALGVGRLPALIAAALFTFGGYLGGRVEQINQYQGLAWLPWLCWLAHHLPSRPRRCAPLLAMAWALQVFTGHTQTVFITAVGLGVYALASPQRARRLTWLALSGVGALLLALPQLIPTAELTAVSNRGAGLNPNEATAFSFNPFLAARGLLPAYDRPIFAEYIAYPGVIALGLALIGLAGRRRVWLVWGALALVGLLFAFGQYNPIYWPLASLPGFNLFRVPARWLVLFALGAAMLAGLGLDVLLTRGRRVSWRLPALLIVVIGGLAAAAWLLTGRNPEPIPFSPPGPESIVGWAAALVAFLLAFALRRLRGAVVALGAAALIELLLAAGALPYNRLIPPDIFSGQRFTISQMRVYTAREQPPGRLLSISDLLFDPGDRAALEARFARLGMSDEEIRIALVAIKQQETLAANLPLYWGIPTIDGFDGGLLPTRYYTAFTSLLLPPDMLRTVDGRLREALAREDCRGACIPDRRWLDLTHTRWLLTDKIYDLWHEDVAYDTQFALALTPSAPLEMGFAHEPPFTATHVDLLYVGAAPPALTAITAAGDRITAAAPRLTALGGGQRIARYALPAPTDLDALVVSAAAAGELRAVTRVDVRVDTFQQAALDGWTRALSSDIKLYENRSVLPRAFVVYDSVLVADDAYGTEDALAILRAPDFDPARTAVILGDGRALSADRSATPAQISAYSAEEVRIEVEAAAPGYLLLSDAYYPGWQATVNDAPAPILRANVMFRAVPVETGLNAVVFRYHPLWLDWLPFGLLMWVVFMLLTGLHAQMTPI